MNSKERVIAALKREPIDRTPIDCWLFDKRFLDILAPVYGSREKFMDEFNIDLFTGFMAQPSIGLGKKLDVEELAEFDLGNSLDPKWIAHTNWGDKDFAGGNIIQAVEQQGDKRAIVAHLWGILEGTSMIIGIQNAWMHLAQSKKKMIAWFDRYADFLCGVAENCAKAGADIVTISDDWGSEGNMLISPRMWRKQIAPYTARIVEHARSQGLLVNLHSDGYIMPVMDEIIEMGFTSLHPIQESAGMDAATVKKDFGDRLTFYGSLDVVEGIRILDGDELTEYITKRFEIYAPGGGFIFNSAHFIQPDVPPERLIHAYTVVNELAEKYGN